MARLLTTGAESGSQAVEGLTSSASPPSLTSAAARTGAFGWRSTALAQYSIGSFTGALTRYYLFRGYFRKSANTPAGHLGILEFENGAGNNATVALNSSGQLEAYVIVGGSPALIATSGVLANDTWYRLEAKVTMNAGSNDDGMEVLLDGVSFANSFANTMGTVAFNTVVWGQFAYGAGTPTAVTIDWDDVVLNDDQGAADNDYPGAGSILPVPVVQGTAESAVTTAGTSHLVTLPASIAATDLVLVTMDIGSTSATVNALAGWTEILDEALANGLKIFQYTGAGVPSDPTFVTSAATRSASIAWRISGADKTTTPVIGTTATGTSLTPDPPAVTPAGGVNSYRFIAFAGMAGEEADDDTWGNTPPTNYTPSPPLQKTAGIAGTNLGGLIVAASLGATRATENPGTFNVDVSAAWRAQTIAVYPLVPSTPVDGGVLDLLWDTRAAADGIVLDLLWDVIAQVAKTDTLLWDLRASADGIVLDAVWDLRAAADGPARTLKWDVTAQIAKTATLLWDVIARVDGIVLDLAWDLSAQVNGASRSLLWDLAGAVARAQTLLWDLVAQVNRQQTFAWDLRAQADGAAERLLWDLRASANAAVQSLVWDLRAAADAAVARLLWDLRAQVDAPTRTLVWDLTAQVNGIVLDLLWDLNVPGPAAVSGPVLDLLWDLVARVDSAAERLVWDVRSEVAPSSQRFVWDTRSEANAAPRTLKWDLRSSVSDPLGLVWDVRTTANGDGLTLVWDLAGTGPAPVDALLTLRWSLHPILAHYGGKVSGATYDGEPGFTYHGRPRSATYGSERPD